MILIAILLLGLYNGFIIQWFNNKNKSNQHLYSKIWHIIGWLIRGLLIFSLPIKFIPLGIFIGWSLYNILINLILGNPLYETGTTNFDKYFNKYIQITIDIILLIINLYIFI